MKRRSALLSAAASANQRVGGDYVAHRDGFRYRYVASWSRNGGCVAWDALVTRHPRMEARRARGDIDLTRLNSEDTECWVRAAVELAIERDQLKTKG